MLTDTLGPLLKRDPEELRGQLCVGPPGQCAELLSGYAAAGCERVHLWLLGDERRQIELGQSRLQLGRRAAKQNCVTEP